MSCVQHRTIILPTVDPSLHGQLLPDLLKLQWNSIRAKYDDDDGISNFRDENFLFVCLFVFVFFVSDLLFALRNRTDFSRNFFFQIMKRKI